MFKSSLTKTSIVLLMSALSLFFIACKKDSANASGAGKATLEGDLAGLVLEDIPGSDVKYARQVSSSGVLQIEGFVKDGKKTGMWVEYTPEGDVLLINHYVDGMLEGAAMRMSFRNQVDLKLNNKQGKLDGAWTAYKFGKVIETRQYKNDKLEGVTRMYDDRTFKLKQEVEYKNGVQDGIYRYYDENGNVTLEYEYKNGEKVSGGMVEPNK